MKEVFKMHYGRCGGDACYEYIVDIVGEPTLRECIEQVLSTKQFSFIGGYLME